MIFHQGKKFRIAEEKFHIAKENKRRKISYRKREWKRKSSNYEREKGRKS